MSDDSIETLLTPDQPDRHSGMAKAVPRQIGRFRIEQQLGQGGFGTVYQAIDEHLKRAVAIKVPHQRFVESADEQEFYLREARTVASLEHPHIVPVLEVGTTREIPIFIVSKFIVGKHLADRLKHARPSYSCIVRWLADIADALRVAHANGIVHRDIKPQNLIVDEEDRIFLVDFGLALRDQEVNKPGVLGGTPAYMSPEQIRGEGHRVDERSDLFSLGILFYEMLTDQRPFRGESRYELFEQITDRDPTPPRQLDETIPAELERICLKMLSKRKSERYANAKVLIDDLKSFLASYTDSPRSDHDASETVADFAVPTPVDSSRKHARSVATDSTSPSSMGTAASSTTPSLKVAPRGLRSFDQRDTDYFLDLVPGPRTRTGLPESLAFWKTRIEELDAQHTFPVGLVYGPSGCGKSSLMKAGLLPRLASHVCPVYIEASGDDTERGLLSLIRAKLSNESHLRTIREHPSQARELVTHDPFGGRGKDDHASGLSLTELLSIIRRGGGLPAGQKLLLVIDQLEQWLNAHPSIAGQQLLEALLQCDGSRVQAIVMVRDDFWMAATRFFRQLDIPLDRNNSAVVDLFDVDHAERVLKAFGRALGKFDVREASQRQERNQFVRQAVTSLAEDGQVIPVRLALFAELIKHRVWVPQTLRQLGGTIGIGAAFFEETFSSAGAPVEHRYHQNAARNVLRALLPEPGTNIKGHMQSREQLLQVSGYQQRPREFKDLLRLLDRDLRLITPVDRHDNLGLPDPPTPEASETGSPADTADSDENAKATVQYYQLTHDYLVPSLRDWLTRKQCETRRGRAELKLAQRTASWSLSPENKQLPTLFEWIGIRWFTNPGSWSELERRMMRQTDRLHGIRAALVLGLVCLASLLVWRAQHVINVAHQRVLDEQERKTNELEATRLVESLLSASTDQVPSILRKLTKVQTYAYDNLWIAFSNADYASNEKLHTAIALSAARHPGSVEPEVVTYLSERLLDVSPSQFKVVNQQLLPFRLTLAPELWAIAQDVHQPQGKRFHALAALAMLEPEVDAWSNRALISFTVSQLLDANPIHLQFWLDALRPVRDRLMDSVSDTLANPNQPEIVRRLATSTIIDYASDDPQRLAHCLTTSDAKSFEFILSALQFHPEAARQELEHVLAQSQQTVPEIPQAAEPITAPVEIESALVDMLSQAHGCVTADMAICQSLPFDRLMTLCSGLEKYGFRPTRIRPYRSREGVLVSAIWTRDSQRWHLQTNLSLDDTLKPEFDHIQHGMVLEDIAVVTSIDSKQPPVVVALWTEKPVDTEDRVSIVDADLNNWSESVRRNRRNDFGSVRSLTVRTDEAGVRRYSGIMSNTGAETEVILSSNKSTMIHKPQADVASASALELASKDGLQRQLRSLDSVPAQRQNTSYWYEQKAWATYYLDDFDKAEQYLQAWDRTGEEGFGFQSRQRLQALIAARRGDRPTVDKVLAELNRMQVLPSRVQCLAIQAAAWMREWESVRTQLADAEARLAFRGNDLIHIARAAAQCSHIAEVNGQSADAHAYAQQALDMIQRCLELRSIDCDRLRSDSEFVPLAHLPEFEALMQGSQVGPFAHVLTSETSVESTVTNAAYFCPPESLQAMMKVGWKPAAVCVAPADAPDAGSVTIVWQRPIAGDEQRENLAVRQTQAAIALLRLGEPDTVWPLLRHSQDPRLRSYLINTIVDFNVLPEPILKHAQIEQDVSAQRALIQLIGIYAQRNKLTSNQLQTAIQWVKTLHTEHADSGIHSSSEWALKQLHATQVIDELHASHGDGQPVADRNWYISKTNQHTMMLIKPDKMFRMGSPIDEEGRLGDANDNTEALHLRKIGRNYAISAHEVSVRQFRAFRESHSSNRGYSKTDDSPANQIVWYDAAAYCNWLSRQEGIPADEWCYVPAEEVGEGLVLRADYLQRTGYRLPTEAEWEYACRAGATTARFYGQSDKLLANYACYSKNAESRGSFPCGSLLPNDFGLFDMQGNVLEWCHDAHAPYEYRQGIQIDGDPLVRLDNTEQQVLRGGSHFSLSNSVRSACRHFNHPNYRNSSIGFRIARTIPPQ